MEESFPGLRNGKINAISQISGNSLSLKILFKRLKIKTLVECEEFLIMPYKISSSPGAESLLLDRAERNSFMVKGILYDSLALVLKSGWLDSCLRCSW